MRHDDSMDRSSSSDEKMDEEPISKTSLRVRKLKPISDAVLRNSMKHVLQEY